MRYHENAFSLHIPRARAAMRVKLGAGKPVQQWKMPLRRHLRGSSSQMQQRDRMRLSGPGVLECPRCNTSSAANPLLHATGQSNLKMK
jgi:hypothetical protein